MPKSNILPNRKSAERLKDVRIKGAQSGSVERNQYQIEANKASKQRPLRREQIDAIFERKNQVNGRYVASFNVKKAILDTYPNLLMPFTSKEQEQINQSPNQTVRKTTEATEVTAAMAMLDNVAKPVANQNVAPAQAPEFAPPPVITEALQGTTNTGNVVTSLDAYRERNVTPEEVPANPQVSTKSNEQIEQDTMLAKARADILDIYSQNHDESKAA